MRDGGLLARRGAFGRDTQVQEGSFAKVAADLRHGLRVFHIPSPLGASQEATDGRSCEIQARLVPGS